MTRQTLRKFEFCRPNSMNSLLPLSLAPEFPYLAIAKLTYSPNRGPFFAPRFLRVVACVYRCHSLQGKPIFVSCTAQLTSLNCFVCRARSCEFKLQEPLLALLFMMILGWLGFSATNISDLISYFLRLSFLACLLGTSRL